MIITRGAVVGRVLEVNDHPHADRIWLAVVDLGVGPMTQIVFGGQYKVKSGDLVPVALPGARTVVRLPGQLSVLRVKKIRRRRYRGEQSNGMLCSLDELGWLVGGPDEVAVLRGLLPGESLDNITRDRRARVVVRPWRLADAGPTGDQTSNQTAKTSTWAS